MDRPKLVIVVGLPGAGKTTYMESLERKGEIAVFYDDYQADAPEKAKSPYLSRYYSQMVAELKRGKTVAASDIRYCVQKELNALIASVISAVPETVFDIRYFKNDPDKCRANVIKRNRKSTDWEFKLIDEYSPQYDPPSLTSELMDIPG